MMRGRAGSIVAMHACLLSCAASGAAAPLKGTFVAPGVTGQKAFRPHGWKRENVYLARPGIGDGASAWTDENPAGPFAFAVPSDTPEAGPVVLFNLSHSDIPAYGRRAIEKLGAGDSLLLESPAHYSVMYDRGAEEWGEKPYLGGDDFYQTFVATSRHVTRIATRLADKSGDHEHLTLNYAVYKTNDGPPSTWKRISPIRSRFLSGGTDPIIHIFHVAFRSNEVELEPGRTYAIRLWRDPKSQSQRFAIVARPDKGDGYAQGHAYQGDKPLPDQDLFAYVSGGEAGTLVNYAPVADFDAQKLAGSATRFGQVFRATGDSLLAAESIFTNGQAHPEPMPIAFQVYDRPGGSPIGPKRTCTSLSLAYQGRAAVAWMPGEVPLVPGQLFYIEWSARECNTWLTSEPLPGQAYRDGKPLKGADLLLALVEQEAAADANARGTAEPPGPQRFRLPAPAEDADPLVEEPVFGACAGHTGSDASLQPMEWVAKRTWHVLGLEYNRKDFTGPPAMSVKSADGWLNIEGTVVDGGVPARNQVITCEVQPAAQPLLVLLRSTDAFGEVLVELDLLQGKAVARSVSVSRTMIGGQSHSSPQPEQSSNRVIATAEFAPVGSGTVSLRIRTQGERISIQAQGNEIFAFSDPDPAGGKFGFGSTGSVRIRNVQQWELISERERQRRLDCVAHMHAFCKQLDAMYPDDVRGRNRVEKQTDGLLWTWPATGATARFTVDGPRIRAVVRSGLYGDEALMDGHYPGVIATDADGQVYTPDANGKATITGDNRTIEMTVPLKNGSGKTATARITADLTVQTVWFWTVAFDGLQPKSVQANLPLAQPFRPGESSRKAGEEADNKKSRTILRHNARVGVYVKAIEPDHTDLGFAEDGTIDLRTTDAKLRFATVVLPAQPLNLVGFKHRMVHFIRYPEGPVQHWRRQPSFQEYPDDIDLARFAGHGTDAMVWHHTWTGSDFFDREGFIVNHERMARAMAETHRLGMKTIGYLGIVPGRSSLLRFEDLSPQRAGGYGGYEKNWDLQDFTFYHVNGRYAEFIPWIADYWCQKYGLNGFYLDGGSFGSFSHGPSREPLDPEDAGLSLDEIQHRVYYRVRKVLELNHAGYGLEPWSGLDWMLNGFYDCMMIGESFQEASPEYYSNGHNTLLTGCTVKMYGMRESSQNPYNIAMAAVTLGDIQVCSGNGAWGDVADTTDTWARVRPLWDLLESIDWDRLIEARPFYGQELVGGEGFFASNYTLPDRVLIFLANRTEQASEFDVMIDAARLPKIEGVWQAKYCLGPNHDPIGEIKPATGDTRIKLRVPLPALHDGPVGIELRPAK